MQYTRENTRIVYMGTPAISAIVLKGLLDAGFRVVGLIANPDKPLGRKGVLTPCPTKVLAAEYGIPVFQPAKIRLEHDFLDALKPDVIVTMAYGQIVPDAVLRRPVKGCINLHGSLLPALRGAAPIQRALDLGFDKTGVTLMEMVASMDAGRMYDKIEVPIDEEDDYTSLAEKIGIAARDLIVKDLLDYMNDKLPGIPQNEAEVTFANKITPEEEHLDLSKPREELLRHIRALAKTPGAYLCLDGLKLKVLKAKESPLEGGKPGEVILAKKGFVLACDGGAIELLLVQLQGKNEMEGKAFVNGYRDLLGKVLV